MLVSAGMLSLSVRYPSRLVTNDDLRTSAPELVADAERRTLARLWAGQHQSEEQVGRWAEAMQPHLADPFRGAVQRRHLAPGESSLSLELVAAREAIERAGLTSDGIDLVIASSFLPDQIGLGDATFVCKSLGLRAAAFNLESACSGSLAAFHAACAFVEAGRHRAVLVVISCAYSRCSDPDDTLGWFLGDGAVAFVVGEVGRGEGLLSYAARHTGELCGTFRFDLDVRSTGEPWIVIRAAETAGRTLAENQDAFVLDMTSEALARAGVGLADIRLFVVNTPTAWFHRYFAALLGVDPERTITTYPYVANTGPVLLPANLHFAAHRGRIGKGELALLFSIGSVSSTAASVIRWGDVALGDDPLASSNT